MQARIIKAYNLPAMDGAQGCTDCYVKVQCIIFLYTSLCEIIYV